MLLSDLTWREVADLSRDIVVVLPFGAVEQHSFHLPLSTDAVLAEALAHGLEQRMPDRVLAMPVVWLGCSRHHMDFPGSLTSKMETLIAVGEDIVESMAEHGFRNVVLLNAHGGNHNVISSLVERLRRRPGAPLRVVGVTYWHLITEEVQAIRETPLGGMGHACELETSLMLAVRPQLVHRDRLDPDGPRGLSDLESRDMFHPGAVTTGKTFKELSAHGGFGDPTTASAEKGERILAILLAKLARVVDEIQNGIL